MNVEVLVSDNFRREANAGKAFRFFPLTLPF